MGTVNGIALVIRRLDTGGVQRALTIVTNTLVKIGRTVYAETCLDAGKDFFRGKGDGSLGRAVGSFFAEQKIGFLLEGKNRFDFW